jgi:peroxiredoxin
MRRFSVAWLLLSSAVGVVASGIGSFGLATTGLGPSGAWAAETDGPIGKRIDGFSLHDQHGKVHQLSDYQGSKAIVVAFLGIECPLAKLYGPRLEQLAAEYGEQGVTVLAIDSNRQDSVTELGSFAKRHKLTFPLLKDPDNRVADMFAAQRTPEAYLLDSDGVIRYFGRIDDQYGQHLGENGKRISYQLTEPRRRDLAVAIDELLAGKSVSEPLTEAVGCLIGRVRQVTPGGEITFTKHISRIMNQRCVECHREGEIAPFSLSDYDEVVGWSEMIREVVAEERMPPWHANPEFGEFSNDCRLSAEEKQQIFDWVDNGSPEGDAADLPAPPTFVDGWTAGEPDQVIYLPETFQVAATGTVDYQYYEVDPGWTEDKWIRVAEARPDNRAVVHHILCFVRSPSASPRGLENGVGIGWAPGTPAHVFEPNTAMHVPAGSKIIFQMHYTPNGTPQQDRSYVGFQFADKDEVEYMVSGGAAMTPRFRIPAGHNNYRVDSSYEFDRDQLLLSMLPHMHLRGKSFRYTAHYPDGREEVLLDIPRYDFNWQLRYELAEPKLMPKGTEIRCVAHYDNSAENMTNPDPTVDVTWGDQTWEEMMIGFFTTREVEPVDFERLKQQAEEGKKKVAQMEAQAKMFINSMDKNGNGTLSVDEVPEQMQGFFGRIDMNKDGEVDASEAAILVGRLGGGGGNRRGRGGDRGATPPAGQ